MNRNSVIGARSLETSLSYRFRNAELLELALSHRSVGKENNERLEFLGDSILDFLIAEALFRKFRQADEGQLTRLRASLVRKQTLAQLASQIRLGDSLRLGEGELKSGGWRRDSILANALEAVIGASYLDGGLQASRNVVEHLYDELLENISLDGDDAKDSKTQLQEYLQALRQPLPEYSTVGIEGEAHEQKFTVKCVTRLVEQPSFGQGTSRRIAEQQAAMAMLDQLRNADLSG